MAKTDDIETWRLVVDHWRSQGKDLRHLEVPPELAAQLGVPLELTKERRGEDETEDDSQSEDDPMAKNSKKSTKVKQGVKSKKAQPAKKSPPPKTRGAKAVSAAEPTPVSTTPEELPPSASDAQAVVVANGELAHEGSANGEAKWKKRREFEGDMCGYAGCTRKADGYVSGIRSTKEGERDRRSLWFGPACIACVRKWHLDLIPMSLAELARQRNGASDLAAVLDIEVGEVHKRLLVAGIDERGNLLTGNPNQTQQPPQLQGQSMAQQNPGTALAVAEEQHTVAVAVPYNVIGAIRQEMATTAQALGSFVIRTQEQMDYASNYMQRVKGLLNDIEDKRKEIARPFRDVINTIQAHFNPVKADLLSVEGMLKQRIDEAYTWSQQQQQQSFVAAQSALAAGDNQGVALATSSAMSAEMSLSKGVSMRPVARFEFVDISQVPGQFWSPDPVKVQAYLDSLDTSQLQTAVAQGYVIIAGIRVWFESIVASRAA